MLVPYHDAMNINRTATVMTSKESAAYTVKFYPNGIINPSTLPSDSNALKSVLLVSDANEKLCLRTHLKKNDILHGSIIVRDDIYASIMGDNEDIELWEAFVNSFYHDELNKFISIDYACPERKKEKEEERKSAEERMKKIRDAYNSVTIDINTDNLYGVDKVIETIECEFPTYSYTRNDGFNTAYVTIDDVSF